jgi:hypothetical protein
MIALTHCPGKNKHGICPLRKDCYHFRSKSKKTINAQIDFLGSCRNYWPEAREKEAAKAP